MRSIGQAATAADSAAAAKELDSWTPLGRRRRRPSADAAAAAAAVCQQQPRHPDAGAF